MNSLLDFLTFYGAIMALVFLLCLGLLIMVHLLTYALVALNAFLERSHE